MRLAFAPEGQTINGMIEAVGGPDGETKIVSDAFRRELAALIAWAEYCEAEDHSAAPGADSSG